MLLAAGVRLGPYEIVGALGAGGMGEVYRARDTRLQRDVAIKILPAAVATDPVAHARFEREAQAVAALSHPNILAIHDVGREGDRSYAVMELLEGRNLREVLRDGALPLRKCIDYALQLAHGLAAAHARGIVHRDVKPENVFVCSDGRVKILDFGLAASRPRAEAETVTATAFDTSPGTIVGTTAYMAPEQIRGADVDARVDIFALGLVLYEMVAGSRAFGGATSADVMSAILRADPEDLSAKRHDVLPALDRLIRRCLEKSPDERFQSARDLAFALDAIASGTSGRMTEAPALAPRSRTYWWVAAAAALFAGLAIGLLVGRGGSARPAPVELTPVRFTMPSAVGQPPWVAVAPDGMSVAWTQADPVDNSMVIWVRRLSEAAPVPLPWSGRGDAVGSGQFSPDGRSLVIMSLDGIAAYDVASGARRQVYRFPEPLQPTPGRGMTVTPDGLLVGGATISRIPLDGGDAVPLTALDTTRHVMHTFPRGLPDGRFLFAARRRDQGADVFVAASDGKILGQLPLPTTVGRVLPDPSGAIVYVEGSSLYGQPIDWSSLKLTGTTTLIASNVLSDLRVGAASVDLSPSGVLAYRITGNARVQFEWADRSGRTLATIAAPDTYTNFDLSPDGRTIAVTRRDQIANRLWMIDVERSIATPSDKENLPPPSDPTWSPDGRLLAFRRGQSIVIRPAFGGEERTLANWSGYPDAWSPDGRYVLAGRPNGPAFELWAVATGAGPAEGFALTPGANQADEGRFSPDGHWVVFHAALERGARTEIFAIPFPPTGERFQLSANGGVQPRWRRDGRELLYLDLEGQLMSVEVPNGDVRQAKRPQVLFRTTLEPSSANDQFTIAPDGRLLLRRPLESGGSDQAAVTVLVNWRKITGLP